jgi:asparagine synthase (glutamine-hydrolysing)
MCGICGIVKTREVVTEEEIRAMRDVLSHRGPDQAGAWVQGRVGLGHCRLSIIDLSAQGSQPMFNETGSIALVFNGEIYNFKEIRRVLEKKGHIFRSHSDSEAIIHAYEEYGVDCLQHLRGMFAFALWDSERKQLVAARDRLGKKPFFYSLYQGDFFFGSEIKSILSQGRIPREIDLDALGYFLSLNYTPAPHTLFKGIKQLEPGQYLIWNARELHVTEFWDLSYPPAVAEIPQKDVFPRFEAALQEAIRLRLIADVPVGAFLSGGLDSSTVVALAAPLYPGQIKTFAIGFGEKSYDERPYAQKIASRYNTEHHEIQVNPDVEGIVPQLVWHAEEPTADSSMLPLYYLSQFAAQKVKVVLTGDGADEILAGYPTYQAHYLLKMFQKGPEMGRQLVQKWANSLPVSHKKVGFDFKLKRFAAALDWDGDYAHYSWRRIWSPVELQGLLPGVTLPEAFPLYLHWLKRSQTDKHLNRMLYADTRFYLPNDMLVKVDRMTMAHALEARCPFLDQQVVELAARLPYHWKIRGLFLKKYLLRRLLKNRAPAAIRWQNKRGFNVPVGLWIKGPLRDYFWDHLKELRHLGWIDMRFLEKIFSQHLRDATDYSHHLWGLLILSLWWQLYLKNRPPQASS